MNLTFEQLHTFTIAAECGSFSAAARKMGRAQSYVSTQISHLEIELGFELFDRSGRTPQLTASGTRMLQEAHRVIMQREHFQGVAYRLDQGVEAQIKVALDEFYPEHLIGGLLAEFAQEFPSVEVTLLFPLLDDVSDMILQGEADIGVLWRPQGKSGDVIETRRVGLVPLKLVCAKNHPLAQHTVDYERLTHFRQLIVATRGRRTLHYSERISSDLWWVESHFAMLELVKHGVGWAMMSDHVIASSPTYPYLATPGAPGIEKSIELEVGWHRQRGLGPAGTWLVQRIQQKGLPALPPFA
ncbi:hypothetical protein LMG33818_002025 [Halomonadaceae bacterium LMG 33818]|uniref:LysR family transcriptional regulator n=1 Tax=Cernens ardua TaxID=3402176 RepID=UPI003EDBD2EC